MSSILQKGIIPDRQYDVDRPLTGKNHINGPANIQDVVTGPCWVYGTRRNVEGTEGHRHVTQCTTTPQKIQRQETALRLALDVLLFGWVKPKKAVDIVAVLNVENHLRKLWEKKNYQEEGDIWNILNDEGMMSFRKHKLPLYS